MSLYRDRFVLNYLSIMFFGPGNKGRATALEDGLAANFDFTWSKYYKCHFIAVPLLFTVLVLIGVPFRVLS